MEVMVKVMAKGILIRKSVQTRAVTPEAAEPIPAVVRTLLKVPAEVQVVLVTAMAQAKVLVKV